jgi:hypothetical protein
MLGTGGGGFGLLLVVISLMNFIDFAFASKTVDLPLASKSLPPLPSLAKSFSVLPRATPTYNDSIASSASLSANFPGSFVLAPGGDELAQCFKSFPSTFQLGYLSAINDTINGTAKDFFNGTLPGVDLTMTTTGTGEPPQKFVSPCLSQHSCALID